ncbi:MAG: hypothetical protein QM817_09810 [Archangium sp.]
MLATLLTALGVLNLFPAAALLRPSMFERLYGVRAETPELRVVLRHRAALLGCVGVTLLVAAADRAFLWPAVLFAIVSKVTFLGVYVLERPAGPLQRVARADGIALLGLAIAAALY